MLVGMLTFSLRTLYSHFNVVFDQITTTMNCEAYVYQQLMELIHYIYMFSIKLTF